MTTYYQFGKIYDISAFINDNYKEEDNYWILQKLVCGNCTFSTTNVKLPQDDESLQILKHYFKNKDLYQNKVINNLIFENFTEISIKLAINLIKANES